MKPYLIINVRYSKVTFILRPCPLYTLTHTTSRSSPKNVPSTRPFWMKTTLLLKLYLLLILNGNDLAFFVTLADLPSSEPSFQRYPRQIILNHLRVINKKNQFSIERLQNIQFVESQPEMLIFASGFMREIFPFNKKLHFFFMLRNKCRFNENFCFKFQCSCELRLHNKTFFL